MFPGLLVWGTFAIALILSFFQPLWVIIFIILFDLLWFFRVVYFNIFLVLSWLTYRRVIHVDWQQRIESLPGSEKIHHLVFLPTYKEHLEIIRSTIRSLQENSFPND